MIPHMRETSVCSGPEARCRISAPLGGDSVPGIASGLYHPVTAVDGPAKLDFLRKLGADRVLDYTREPYPPPGQTFDLILDTVDGREGTRRLFDTPSASSPQPESYSGEGWRFGLTTSPGRFDCWLPA